MKLPTFVMEAFSQPGDVVFEPSAGSGAVLAGQRTGRVIRAIELAPAYVDLAITRWRQNHPDLPVTLDGDSRDYDAVAAERAAAQKWPMQHDLAVVSVPVASLIPYAANARTHSEAQVARSRRRSPSSAS